MSLEMTLKIGSVLKKQLESQRLSIRELSKLSGVPASTLAEWLNNRAPKNPVHAQKVASVLGMTLHCLLFGEEDHQEPIQKLLKEDVFSGMFEINIRRVQIKGDN